jgi:ATP-binding cassette subfamily B protein
LSGEIASKITDFHDSTLNLIYFTTNAIGFVSTVTIGIVFLFTVSSLLAYVCFAFIGIYSLVLYFLLQKQLALNEIMIKARQKTIGVINDSVTNVFGIKVIGNVLTEMKLKLSPAIDEWSNATRKAKTYDAYYVDMADTILAVTASGIQICLLIYLYRAGQITSGGFALAVMITLALHESIDAILQMIMFSINPEIARIRAAYQFISIDPDVIDQDGAIVLKQVKGDIKYENITFKYSGGVDVFSNLSLHIKRGERVGIVGASGAGKTTFVKCLLRYFDPVSGSILVDDHDILDVTQDSLRANISVIPQDITMFHRTILENLQIAKQDAKLSEIKAACKKAKIHDDIERMPNGYDSIVGERGVKVSGGQRQRIAIARAILKNAPILILDEATSALDTPTEKLIQESINEMLETTKATTIVIAHRLSTLRHMDRILVFEKGKIVQEGKHQALIKKKGLYKTLWDAQVGGFLPNESEV